MNKLFCCYSVPLRKFLQAKGEKYELCGKNPNNDAMFWVFFRTLKLENLLAEWSKKPESVN